MTAWTAAPQAASATAAGAPLWARAAGVGLVLIFSQAWVFPLLGEKGDPSASGLVRALFIPAYAAGAILAASAPWRMVLGLARQPFLGVLMAIVGLSILWSASPDETLRRTVALYATTLAGVALAARFTWAELAEVLATAFALLAVAAFLVALVKPDIGVMHTLFPGAWRGVWPEKNALGGNMSFGVCLLAAAGLLNPQRARLWWGFAGLALLLVLLSTSKTSLVSLMLGLGALGFIALARRGPVAAVITAWTGVVGVLVLAGVAVFASDQVFAVLGKDATLTGRTRIWAAVWREIQLRPWTGYGYGTVWTDTSGWGPLAWIVKQVDFKPQHAHNAWLEQWLGLGVFGLAAFALVWLEAMVLGLWAVFRRRGAYLAVPFLVVYSLVSLTESIGVTYNDFRWAIFAALAVKLALGDPPERG